LGCLPTNDRENSAQEINLRSGVFFKLQDLIPQATHKNISIVPPEISLAECFQLWFNGS